MNTPFMICFNLLAMLLMFLNLKHWNKMKRGMKRLYFGIYALTIGLYVASFLGYRIPMPTAFFINHVSPWVFHLIHG